MLTKPERANLLPPTPIVAGLELLDGGALSLQRKAHLDLTRCQGPVRRAQPRARHQLLGVDRLAHLAPNQRGALVAGERLGGEPAGQPHVGFGQIVLGDRAARDQLPGRDDNRSVLGHQHRQHAQHAGHAQGGGDDPHQHPPVQLARSADRPSPRKSNDCHPGALPPLRPGTDRAAAGWRVHARLQRLRSHWLTHAPTLPSIRPVGRETRVQRGTLPSAPSLTASSRRASGVPRASLSPRAVGHGAHRSLRPALVDDASAATYM